MAEKVELQVGVEDDASKNLDKIAGKAEDLSKKPYDIDLRVDAADAEGDLNRVIDQVTETAEKIQKLDQKTITFRVNADQLDAVEKQLTGITTDVKKIDDQTVDITIKTTDIDRLNQNLGTAKKGVEETGGAAEKSKSALANMIGNSIQDLGQLGGVAGSAGVAIGQMGEYIADASLAGGGFAAVAGSFAKVALPIAALSIAVPLLANLLGSLGDEERKVKKATEDMGKAMEAAGDVTIGFHERILSLIKDTPALRSALTDIGITGLGFANIVEGDVNPNLAAAQQLLNGYAAVLGASNAAGQTSIAGEKKYADSLGLTVEELRKRIAAARKITEEANIQSKALENNTNDTEADAKATADLTQRINLETEARKLNIDVKGKSNDQLREEIDLSKTSVARSKEIEASWRDARETTKAWDQAVADLGDSLRKVGAAWDESKQAADSFENVFSQQVDTGFAVHQAYADVEDGIGRVAKAVSDAGDDFKRSGGHLTTFTDDGRKVLDSVQQVAGAIGISLSTELKNAGGNYDVVRQKSTDYRNELISQLTQLGLNSDEIQNYVEFLGLTPEQVETTIRLSQQDEARKKIQELNVDLLNLPPEVRTQVIAATDKGDYISAYQVLFNTLTNNGKGITTDVQANTDPATTTVNSFVLNAEGNVIKIPVHADTSPLQATLDYLQSHPPAIFVDVFGRTHVNGAMAGGPINESGFYDVGEAGRERVFLPRGANVMSAGQVMTADAGGGGDIHFHITINASPLANPADIGGAVVTAIKAYERRSGKGWRAA